jgi:putative endonuclease
MKNDIKSFKMAHEEKKYFVYMLKCSDETLYTGIAQDVNKRLHEHNSSPKGAKYTRGRRPVTLVYSESCEDKSTALKREYAIKKLTRAEKEMLLSENF